MDELNNAPDSHRILIEIPSEDNAVTVTAKNIELCNTSLENTKIPIITVPASELPNYSIQEDDIPMEIAGITELPITNISSLSPACKVRKRKHAENAQNWKRNITKKQRNLGLQYISTSGKLFEERKVKAGCKNCKYKCSTFISAEEREEICKNYWNSGSVESQRNFIMENITPIERDTAKSTVHNIRNNNFSYSFRVNNCKIRVCKQFFCSTLSISDRTVRTAISKFKDGFVEPDKRGRHGKQPKLDGCIKNEIMLHINSIPRIESHYLRQQTSKEFIEGGKTVAELHRDYVRMCVEQNKPYGNYLLYRRIFHTNFNISFFVAKKDQCTFCEQNRILGNEFRSAELEFHLKEKELCRMKKNKDKEDAKSGDCLSVVFDLQAVLPTPASEVSAFYYKSKLSVYNFTIFNLGTDQGHCYVWHEGESRRGVNEIGTCLFKFLNENYCSGKDVRMYSDNCSGQNKNQ